MNNAEALAGRPNRWTNALIRILLLAFAGLMAWWMDQKQTEFGELYAEAVTAKRPDLRLGASDFEGQVARVEFQLVRVPEGGVIDAPFVSALGGDLKSVFCDFVNNDRFDDDLDVPLLNVGVRYGAGDHLGWILSHAYSINTCASRSS